MSKFNVGDRVRYLTEGSYGDIGTVVSIEGHGMVSVDTHGEYGICLEKEIDLERIGPIRTVTRREIVPGVYGRFEVTGTYMKNRVTLDFAPASVGTSVPIVGMDADELREAAHLFNQLAEALAENGK